MRKVTLSLYFVFTQPTFAFPLIYYIHIMRHGLATSRPMQMSDPKVLHLYPHVDYYDHCRSARMSPDPESPHSEKLPRIHDIAIQASYEDLTVPIPTHVDADMEGRVWRKLDLRLLPVVTMFYFLSFLVSS